MPPDSTARRPVADLHAGEGNPIGQVTLRDWFAGLAMQALVGDPSQVASATGDLARRAYALADAMLAQRTRG